MRNITFDQSRRVDLDSGKPLHAEVLETKLKMKRNRIAAPKSNQWFLNFIATPQFVGKSAKGRRLNNLVPRVSSRRAIWPLTAGCWIPYGILRTAGTIPP